MSKWFLLVFALSFGAAVNAQPKLSQINRADEEVHSENYEEAERIYREVLKKSPKDMRACVSLGMIFVKQNRIQEAKEIAEFALKISSTSARAFSILAFSHLRSGQLEQALKEVQRALKLNTNDSLAHSLLAESDLFHGEFDKARIHIKEAIALDPEEPDYYIIYGRICTLLNSAQEAVEAYKKYLSISKSRNSEVQERIRGLIRFYESVEGGGFYKFKGAEPISIPFELIKNRIYVSVRINEKLTLRFTVSTDSSLTVISETAAKELGILPITNSGLARTVGGAGSFPIMYSLLKSIQFEDVQIENIPAYVRTIHTPAGIPENEKSDGMIGLALFSNHELTIDYQKKILILAQVADDSTSRSSNPKNEIQLKRTSGGLLSAEIYLPGKLVPMNFIIGTGSSASVISTEAVKNFNLEKYKLPDQIVRVVGGGGIQNEIEVIGIPEIWIKKANITSSLRTLIINLNPVNETSGFEQHGILGGDFLRKYKVILNTSRLSLSLYPNE